MRLLILLCILALQLPLWSQNHQETAIEIILKSMDAAGGLEAFQKEQTSFQSYTLIQDKKKIANIVIIRDKGQRYLRSIISLSHTPSTRIYDGHTLYDRYGEGVTLLSGNEVPAHTILKTYLSPVEGYMSHEFNLERLEDERIGNQEFYTIFAESGENYGTINYFNPSDYQLSMIVYPGNNRSILAQRDNYHGLQLPSAIINKEEDGSINVLQLNSHSSPYTIDESLFKIPQSPDESLPEIYRFGTFQNQDGTTIVRDQVQTLMIENGDTTKYFNSWKFKHLYSCAPVSSLQSDRPINSSDIIMIKILAADAKEQFLHIYEKGTSRIEKWFRKEE